MWQYFLEYFSSLRAVQATLKIDCTSGQHVVKFCNGSITVSGHDHECNEGVDWRSCSFPCIWTKTLTNLRVCPSKELHVRFKAGTEPADLQQRHFLVSEEQRILMIVKDDCMVQFRCHFCKCKLIEQRYSCRRICIVL